MKAGKAKKMTLRGSSRSRMRKWIVYRPHFMALDSFQKMLCRFGMMQQQRIHIHLIFNIYAVNSPVYSVTLKIYGNKGKTPIK